MWLLSAEIFIFCKIWSLINLKLPKVVLIEKIYYLFFWVGLDPKTFLQKNFSTNKKFTHLIIRAISQLLLGTCLFIFAQYYINEKQFYFRAWIAMIGVIFILHFGMFLLNAIFWQFFKYNAKPLMKNPLLSSSVSDFWSNRWNTGFRDFAYVYIFKPTFKYFNLKLKNKAISYFIANFSVFFFSGIAHEAVVSLPSKNGYGMPFLYFMIQFFGIVFEKKLIKTNNTFIKRITAYIFIILPVPLLFHSFFIKNVITPFINEFRI